MKHYNQTMKMVSTQLYHYLMNIHKNSFENVNLFFSVFQKLPSQLCTKKSSISKIMNVTFAVKT